MELRAGPSRFECLMPIYRKSSDTIACTLTADELRDTQSVWRGSDDPGDVVGAGLSPRRLHDRAVAAGQPGMRDYSVPKATPLPA
jgi:hypothetical protein